MWFIIFIKDGYINDEILWIIRCSRKGQRVIRSYYLSGGSIRKTLTPRIIEKIWNGSLCSNNMRLSESPMDLIGIAKRAGILVRWYEI